MKKLLFFPRPNDNRGYILLISILVIGAVALAATIAVLFLGIGATKSGMALHHSQQAKSLANACAEEALQQMRNATSYTGSGNLSLSGGSCSYTVSSTGGNNRQITASGVAGTATRRLTITTNAFSPKINVASWQETAN